MNDTQQAHLSHRAALLRRGADAARVAAERGHDVTLFEKQDQLGGQITLAAKAPQRDQIAGITRWYQLELARLGIDLRLSTPADEATILDLRPDVVLLANGGHSFLEQNEHWGAAEGLVVSSWDVLAGKVAPGKNVLVYDTSSSALRPRSMVILRPFRLLRTCRQIGRLILTVRPSQISNRSWPTAGHETLVGGSLWCGTLILWAPMRVG